MREPGEVTVVSRINDGDEKVIISVQGFGAGRDLVTVKKFTNGHPDGWLTYPVEIIDQIVEALKQLK